MEINSSLIHDPVTVLKFWHIVEFFTPFDLNEVRSRPNAKCELTEHQLFENGNNRLPWLSEQAFYKAGGIPSYEYRYNLYLLHFNKNELTKISQEIFPWDREGIKHFEFEEKFDDEGDTCFAQLPLDSRGRPTWDKMSISTLPWALGKLSAKEIQAD
jgi:hypothetical protein